MAEEKKRVVVLDDDHDVADIIQSVLLDEGFAVSCLYGPDDKTMERAVLDLSPDCVVVDGSGPPRSPDPWTVAITLARHTPPIPMVRLSGNAANLEEAMLGETERARTSAIAAIVSKPFDIDRLVAAVRNAMGASAATDVSRTTARADTSRLMERLRVAGAHELHTSEAGREWITFRAKPNGDLFKLYRWQSAGTYFIGRYTANGQRLEPPGELYDTEAVIVYCEPDRARTVRGPLDEVPSGL